MTNCKNCGAPLDTERKICSYCGTRYSFPSELDLHGVRDYLLDVGDEKYAFTGCVEHITVEHDCDWEVARAWDGRMKHISFPYRRITVEFVEC